MSKNIIGSMPTYKIWLPIKSIQFLGILRHLNSQCKRNLGVQKLNAYNTFTGNPEAKPISIYHPTNPLYRNRAYFVPDLFWFSELGKHILLSRLTDGNIKPCDPHCFKCNIRKRCVLAGLFSCR